MKETAHPHLSQSAEDYLEAIYLESQNHPQVRVKDIADRLSVAAASVSQAVKTLASHGLVVPMRYGAIELTEKGMEIGKRISSTHHILSVFFEEILGMNHAEADRDACITEHGLSPDAIARLSCLVKWITTKRSGKSPLQDFRRHITARLGKHIPDGEKN